MGLTPNNKGIDLLSSGCENLFEEEPTPNPEPETSKTKELPRLLPEICESNDENKHKDIRDHFRMKSCEHENLENLTLITTPTCIHSSLNSIDTLKREHRWTQKQLNYISHYALLNKDPKLQLNRNLYNDLKEIPSQDNINEFINNIRSNIGLDSIENISFPSGCENLFNEEEVPSNITEDDSETEADGPCIDCGSEGFSRPCYC